MSVQIISRDGEPEYAVVPWDEYQALLRDANRSAAPPAAPERPAFAEVGARRQAQGVSIAELARTVGISPAYLEMIERGEREPDAAIRRALARALDVAGWEGDV